MRRSRSDNTVALFWGALALLMFCVLGLIGYIKLDEIQMALKSNTSEDCNETTVNDVAVALKGKLQNTPIENITCSELGLYQIHSGENDFYTDYDARFLFFGAVYDLESQTEVSTSFKTPETEPTQEPEKFIAWEELPLDDAIVVGDGDIEMAVYKDINCPYCQRLYEAVQTMPNVKTYYMMTSIFGERSLKPTSEILCSDNPPETLDEYLTNKTTQNSRDCAFGRLAIEQVLDFAKQHNWQGTPVTVRKSDGKVMVGFADKDSFAKFVRGE